LQEKRDLITGLKKRAKYGRPDWNTVFNNLKKENKGPISVFYCGNPALATALRKKCQEFGFKFHKEVF
jgi:NADPH oxidase